MPLYSIQGPDGKTYSIEGPAGATREQVIQAIQARLQQPIPAAAPQPVEQPADSGFFRQALDIPVQVARGGVGGIRMLADVFGAGSSASQALKSADTWLADLLSAEAQKDQRRVAQILKDAENKGVLDQVKAGFQAFLVAPADLISQALGSTAPVVIAGLASGPAGAILGTARLGAAAMPAVGAAMGVGEVKGSIYESVEQAYKEKGASDEVARAKALEAQSYASANLPSMVAAGGLGALAGGVGIERPLASMLSRGAVRDVAEQQALREAERGLASRVGLGALKEGAPEFLQAGQSQLAQNIALRNEGFDVPLFQGVFAAGTLEGSAGAILGGGLAVPRTGVERLPGQQENESDAEFARRMSREIEAARREPPSPLTQPITPAAPPVVAAPEGEDVFRLPDGSVGTLDQARAYAMNLPPEQRASTLQSILTQRVPREKTVPPDLFTQPTEKPAEQAVEKPAEGAAPTKPVVAEKTEVVEPAKPPAVAMTKEEEEVAADAAKGKPEQSFVTGYEPVEVPLDQLKLSKEVPQFKADADQEGIVERLEGKFDRINTAPIQVWKRLDGSLEVISGRHRFDLAKRSGEKTIPAQIHDEATGFDADQASILDATLNIRDQQGKGRDYVAYFRKSGISEEDASARGLLGRAPGKPAFAIAKNGSEELVGAHRADIVSDAGAAAIANAAPGDSRLQAVGIKAIQEGKSPLAAVNIIKAVQEVSKGRPAPEGGDLFGFDDSAMREAEEMAKIATLKQNQIAQRLAAISGASRRPEIAKKEGIDIKDPDALKKREKELRQQKASWDNWSSSSDLVQEIRKEMEPKAEKPEEKPSAREAEPAKEIKEVPAEIQAKIDALGKALQRIMSRYGLRDVALRLVADMKAEGEYASKVLSLALDAVDPVSALRHESIHALKELGFFTPAQWKSLERQAKEKWVDQYLKQKNVNRQPIQEGQLSRYDAYMKFYGGDEEAILEEAIADAFADFRATKAPPGMLQALVKKLWTFFQAVKEAFGAEPDAERIFKKVERGELRGKEVAAPEVAEAEEAKPSLRVVEGKERPDLGKNVTVDTVGKYFDDQVVQQFGGKLNYNNPEHFNRALKQAIEEVKYQIKQKNSGLDWYEEDVQKAFKNTIKVLPQLKKEDNRILFSVMAGIMSPETNARDNWFIAAKAFEHYINTGDIPGVNPENGNLWMGGTQSANKKIQLEFLDRMVKDLGLKKAIRWLMNPQLVKDINQYRAKYGLLKSGIGGKATDLKPNGLFAFGEKVGPFISNLNGIHDVTVDKWFIRTFNRYFGTMIGPDGKIINAPTEPQRRVVKELANRVAKDAGIKNYQVQSLLWFYEQRLFTQLGAQSPSYGFSDGSKKFLDARGKGAVPAGAVPAEQTGPGRTKPSLRDASWSEDRIATLMDKYSYLQNGREKDTKAYAGFVRPEDFLAATTPAEDRGRLEGEKTPLDVKRLAKEDQEIFLDIKPTDETGVYQITGHEGRHRMMALRDAGVRSVPVVFYTGGTKNSEVVEEPYFKAQEFRGDKKIIKAQRGFSAMEMIPISWDQRNNIKETFGGKAGVRFSLRDKLGLYSELEAKVSQGPGKGTAEAWKGYINGLTQKGVKPEEIEWSGVRDWLDLQKGSVTKEDLLSYLKNGGVQVEETVLRDSGDDIPFLDSAAKYRQYTLPGGENYREVLLTLPGSKLDLQKRLDAIDAQMRAVADTDINAWRNLLKERKAVFEKIAGAQDYISSHWEGQPNVLAHIRVNDRTDADGNKVLFVEEIQSDWGQEGKKKGFKGQPIFMEGMRDQPEGFLGLSGSNIPMAPFVTKTEGWLNLALKRIMVMAGEGGYDKVAFVNGDQSAERYDLSKQIDRIDYNKNGNGTFNMSAIRNGAEVFSKEELSESQLADTVGKELAAKMVRGEGKDVAELDEVDRFEPEEDIYTEKDFDYEKTKVKSLAGLDLKVGGEGMKTFYDTIVPTAVKKLLPKVGGGQMAAVKMGEGARNLEVMPHPDDPDGYAIQDIDDGQWYDPSAEQFRNEAPGRMYRSEARARAQIDYIVKSAAPVLNQPGFDVTPAMKERVRTTGLPRFSLRDTVNVDGTERPTTSSTNKPIYPTEEGTKNFWRWFKDSAVVDGEGRPLVVYHGTGADIDTFDVGRSQDAGIWFTPVPGAANMYAGVREGANIIPAYASVQNPYIAQVGEQRDTALMKAFDGGHDGLIVKDKDGSISTLSVFKPTQIKSAIGNVGKFDPVDPSIKASLRDVIDPAIRARIDQTTTPREEKTFIKRITEAIAPKSASSFRAAFLDRYNRLSEYDKELARQMGGAPLLADASSHSAALMSDLSAGVLAGAMGVHDGVGGIPVYVNGYTKIVNNNNTVKGPIAIFAPLAKLGDPTAYQAYQFWAGVKRGTRFDREGREQLFEKADIQKADDLRKQFLAMGVDFEAIQKEWIKFNDGLVQYLKDTGVLSDAAAKEFVKYSDYIPFYRQADGEETVGPQIFASLSGVRAPKKLKGSETPIAEFLETVVRNVQYSIEAGMKNVAAQRAVNTAVAIGQANRLNYVSSAPNVVKVLENGKTSYYETKDLLFVEAMKSLNLGDLPFIGLLAGPANLLRNLVTKDPAFMLANMMRDSMSAWVSSGVKMTPMVDTLTNFTKALRGQNPEYAALLNSGVIGGYDYSQGVEISARRFDRALRKKAGVYTTGEKLARPFTSLWDALETGTQASDAATRMEVYKKTLAATGNEAEALFRAVEVMNFNRKGNNPLVRVLTAAVPFLNARMQGLDVLYRAAFGKGTEANAKEIQKSFFIRGMTIAALSTMYWMLVHEDDEWKRQEQETRDNYWILGDVKIPIPFEIGVLFKVIPERILEYSFGDDTGKDFLKSMARQLTSTLSFNPIPQVALPAIESVTNYSFFTQRPIVSQGLEDVAPAYQIGPGTSRAGELIGGATKGLPTALQLSPIKIDEMIRGYTGTLGGYMMDLFDAIYDLNTDAPKAAKRFEQMPVIRRFAVDPLARGQVTAYYELKNSVDEAVRTANLLERNMKPQEWGEFMQENMGILATKDYVLDLEKSMKDFREMKTFVRASQMGAEEKKNIISNITELENNLASNIQEIKKMIAAQ